MPSGLPKQPVITLSAGPVPAYQRVLQAMAGPVHYDYDVYFQALYEQIARKWATALRTAEPPLILHYEPAVGLEAASASLIGKDDVVLNLASGVYGKGFGYWAARTAKEVVEIEGAADRAAQEEGEVILTGPAIREHLHAGTITIDPAPQHIGPNSVDLTLSDDLLVYERLWRPDPNASFRHWQAPSEERPLDMREPYQTRELTIPNEGLVLRPGILYLGRTVERTYTPQHVPYIGGRSSVGRLGIQVHSTAGFGDLGFAGQWVLELSVVHPVRVYAGARLCQLWFFEPSGELEEYKGHYQNQRGVVPTAAGAFDAPQESREEARVPSRLLPQAEGESRTLRSSPSEGTTEGSGTEKRS